MHVDLKCYRWRLAKVTLTGLTLLSLLLFEILELAEHLPMNKPATEYYTNNMVNITRFVWTTRPHNMHNILAHTPTGLDLSDSERNLALPFAHRREVVKITSSYPIGRPSQVERKSRALDKKAAKMQADAREEARESLKRDALESREVLGLAPAGAEEGEEGEEGEEEEAVPPQVLKERIASVVEVLSDFKVRVLLVFRVAPAPLLEPF